jgi:calpain-15
LDSNTKEVLQYSGCAFDNERDIVVEKEFAAGDYAIYVEVDWNAGVNDKYLAVSCYGEKSVQFSELQLP